MLRRVQEFLHGLEFPDVALRRLEHADVLGMGFTTTPFIRDNCTACIADCYRDSSVMLHFAVSLGDALEQLGQGRVLAALKILADGRNLESLGAVAGNVGVLAKLAKLG